MRLIRGFAWLLAGCGILLLAVGRFGASCAACDLANVGHRYWQIAAILGLAVLAALWSRHRDRGWPVLGASVLLILASGNGGIPDVASCHEYQGRPLRIITFNASANNVDLTGATAWIRAQNPDVLILAEAKGASAGLPGALADILPFRQSCALRIPCSTQLLSRLRPIAVVPMARGDVENRRALSAVAITLEAGMDRPVTVVAVHLSRLWPLGRQRDELGDLAQRLEAFDARSLIVAGDFNATRHNAALANFAAKFGLASVASGPTWPTTAANGGAPSVIAIDHILVGRKVRVRDRLTGPVIGSDHRPVAATLCVGTD